MSDAYDDWALPDDVLAAALDAAMSNASNVPSDCASSSVTGCGSNNFTASGSSVTQCGSSNNSIASISSISSIISSTAAVSSSDSSAAASSSTSAAARSGWGSLRAPSSRDVKGRGGGGTKGLAQGPLPLTHLVVLDFEWTADDRRKMLPCGEITQFPSVLVKLSGRASAVVDEFDTFVRPTFNPPLTPFSIRLTAISQSDVDAAPPLASVLPSYMTWLRSHGLVDVDGRRVGHWAFATWSDADIGGQLVAECGHKSIAVPAAFDSWVDLKVEYKRHFHLEARGGLQACVERLGIPFTGRAHNGLVDSQNTAEIALYMARGHGQYGPAFVFRRPTRGLDANGHTFGSRAAKAAKVAAAEAETGTKAGARAATEATGRYEQRSLHQQHPAPDSSKKRPRLPD